ncbi:NAD(+) synthase [Mycoplasma struthionis]|uniref:NH(3)-dependent NAD(+) synthetase n=2 Tax=Mycoplasma struthionis TaxID=538220 RepID=A0A3G8LK07_9MOLU|nr:NAD(+) synthase [Mycoplasma struthionis]
MKINRKELTKKELKIYEIYLNKIVSWLKQKVKAANASGVALGISGGIDSATLAFISKKAFNENAHFFYFKTRNDKYTEDHVKKLEKKLGSEIKFIDLEKQYNDLIKTLDIQKKGSQANLKSRLFMTSIYSLSQDLNTLVLGTDNFDEFYLGYFTKYGDGGCDLLPFANILKSDVYALAQILGVPDEIIDKDPSANLYEDQTDEKELGFSYYEFESYLRDKTSVNNEIKAKIEHFHKISNHKRDPLPKGPKIK